MVQPVRRVPAFKQIRTGLQVVRTVKIYDLIKVVLERFVDRKDEDSTVGVSEVFLGFIEAESTRAVALAERLMATQAEFGNEPVRCVRKARTVR